VRDGLGLDPFHVLGHSGGRLARPRVRPKPPEGLAGGRSCQVTVVRVARRRSGRCRSVAAGRVLFGGAERPR
jgi:hypothetical protein